jgi:hypothetical protein
MSTTQITDHFESPVWLLQGLGNSPGWLVYHDGQLGLSERDTVLFDVPLASIGRRVFPWYYFGGGMKISVNGTEYRLSFVRPNGAEVLVGRMLPTQGIFVAAQKVTDIADGRAAGRRWREILGGP